MKRKISHLMRYARRLRYRSVKKMSVRLPKIFFVSGYLPKTPASVAIIVIFAIGICLLTEAWLSSEHRVGSEKSNEIPKSLAKTLTSPETSVSSPLGEPNANQPPEKKLEPLGSVEDGIGVDLGKSQSLDELSKDFDTMKTRLPDLFADIRPLVLFDESGASLDVQLVAGPFETKADSAAFCQTIRLQLNKHCESAAYRGDAL